MRRCVVAELLDVGMPLEGGLDDSALDASPASVNHANLTEARARSCLDVSLDNRRDVARRECMQIEVILNRHAVRIVHGPTPCRTTR